jgi:hypothetical protein
MDVGVIDVETCKPVPNVLVDLWHANATGFYAGHNPLPAQVVATPAQDGIRKGLLPAFERTNSDETWLRGAWPTDQNGVAKFTSIFPGYYTGRATHVHVKVHPEWSMLENGTFTSGRLIHTGQFFVDDKLNEEIDKVSSSLSLSLSRPPPPLPLLVPSRALCGGHICSLFLRTTARPVQPKSHPSPAGPRPHAQLGRLAADLRRGTRGRIHAVSLYIESSPARERGWRARNTEERGEGRGSGNERQGPRALARFAALRHFGRPAKAPRKRADGEGQDGGRA